SIKSSPSAREVRPDVGAPKAEPGEVRVRRRVHTLGRRLDVGDERLYPGSKAVLDDAGAVRGVGLVVVGAEPRNGAVHAEPRDPVRPDEHSARRNDLAALARDV